MFVSLVGGLAGTALWFWVRDHLAELNRGELLLGRLGGETGLSRDALLGISHGSPARYDLDRSITGVAYLGLPVVVLGLLVFALWVGVARPERARLKRLPVVGLFL